MYLALLRTLEGLDPSAAHSTVLLRPVKAFLRSRPDTIACLMRMLLKDGMGRWGVSVRMRLGTLEHSALAQDDCARAGCRIWWAAGEAQ